MTRSLRVKLALRATSAVTVGAVALSAITLITLKAALDREVDSAILNVASIQAASLADGPDGDMHFHEWDLTPDEASSVRDLIQYAQVWSVDGESLLRSRYMTSDLPVDAAALRRASAGELTWSNQDFEGASVRTLLYPLERLGEAHRTHVLQVAAPITARNDMLVRAGSFLALLTVLLAGTTALGAWWLAGSAVRPIHEVIDQAEEIEAGSLARGIQAYADTFEYRRLVEVLNTMLLRLQNAFEAQRRFTADASHELRSPLTAMRGEIELALRREREREEYVAVLRSTLEEVVRLSRITEDLLLLARSDSGALTARPEPVEVDGIVCRVVERLERQARGKNVSVAVSASGDTTAEVDPVLVGQVAWNLIENSIKFTPPGGDIRVAVTGNGDAVLLAVEDSGPGFPEVPPDGAFERFYRGDPARSHTDTTGGTGLGLAIVKAVAEAHGGHATAQNPAAGGARVVVRFPRHREPDSRPS